MKKIVLMSLLVCVILGLNAENQIDGINSVDSTPVEIAAITGPKIIPFNQVFTYFPEPTADLFANGGKVVWGVSHLNGIDLSTYTQGHYAYVKVTDPKITNFVIYCYHVTSDGQKGQEFERQIFIGSQIEY